MNNNKMTQLAVNTIRTRSIEAVQAAGSGHPGAPLVYTIWNRTMNFDPQDPIWPNHIRPGVLPQILRETTGRRSRIVTRGQIRLPAQWQIRRHSQHHSHKAGVEHDLDCELEVRTCCRLLPPVEDE